MSNRFYRLCSYRNKAVLIGGIVLTLLSFSRLCYAYPQLDCVIIDTDAHLDDMRAIAVLAATKRIKAIVTTEGIADRFAGALAIQQLLQRIGSDNIPVFPGEEPNPKRKFTLKLEQIKEWRAIAQSLNGTFPNLGPGSNFGTQHLANDLRPKLDGCDHVELLVIGPWTSFMSYGPELLDRIDLIVAQGRPDPDEQEGRPSGFNCLYDESSCLSAFDLLVGREQRVGSHLRANWVDIPQSPEPLGSAEPGVAADGERIYPFSPTLEWANDLRQAGRGARVISEILLNDPNGWKATSLWDDLAALYLLRPELFGRRGGHWEPRISATTVRRILTEYMGAGGDGKVEESAASLSKP